jgi:hypothetical protein
MERLPEDAETGCLEEIMITARAPREKRAMAAALAVHDPSFLADLKMITGYFGMTVAVHYLADDSDIQAAVEKEYRDFLQRERGRK